MTLGRQCVHEEFRRDDRGTRHRTLICGVIDGRLCENCWRACNVTGKNEVPQVR